MIRLVLCTALLLAAGFARCEERYLVSARIFQGQHLVGAPALTVAAGKDGKAALAGEYELVVGVRPMAGGSLQVASELAVGPDRLAPRMQLVPGQTGSAERGALRLELTVHQIDQRSG